MKDTFSGYHPAVNFLYFSLVLLFTMAFMHPAFLFVSLTGSVAYSVFLGGRRAARAHFLYMLPLLLITALINPAFNHEGATILGYFHTGNPLTLESIVYGAAASVMLISVLCWFSCYNAVMTSDKFVYLFGRVIPAMSLILSMTLRFVPRLAAQLKVVSNAQKCVGRDAASGGILRRAKNGMAILSILVTWSLENAVETADSMKSRGYGLPGRTAFSIYRFDSRDRRALIFLLFCAGYILTGVCLGAAGWTYFPTLRGARPDAYFLSVCVCYLGLCVWPIIIEVREDRKWNALRSAT